MTSDHPLRRILARVCSATTMSHVVDPTLADMRFERGRRSWRGYLTLARALAVHLIVSTPGMFARMWSDDRQALPRAAAACVAVTALLVAALIASPIGETGWLNPLRAIVLLSPQAVAVALPASLLVAIPLGFRRMTNPRRLLVRGLALSLLCMAVTLGVITRLVPDANQAFRVEALQRFGAERVDLERGPMEMTFGQLRERIELLRRTIGEVPFILPGRGPGPTPAGEAARRFEYAYQLKLAMGLIAVPLGLVAIAITMSRRGRARPILVGTGCVCAYILTMFALDGLSRRFLLATPIPPVSVAWTPGVILLLTAAAWLRGRQFAPINEQTGGL